MSLEMIKKLKGEVDELKKVFDEVESKHLMAKIIEYVNLKSDSPIILQKTSTKSNEPKQGDLFASAGVEMFEKENNTIKNTNHKYILVDNDEKLELLLKTLESTKEFCFDTETTSINAISAEL